MFAWFEEGYLLYCIDSMLASGHADLLVHPGCLILSDCSRIIWILVLLTALGLFLALVIQNIITLSKHPKTVDVEINYNSTMTFPTLTICNQNTFR